MKVLFEYGGHKDGHVRVTDEFGSLHEIPDYMVELNYKHKLGDEIYIDLSQEYCDENDIFY